MSKSKGGGSASSRESSQKNSKWVRETIESIAVAIILAFLFRSFIAEAFVIPTGSMAPTLQGRHLDVSFVMCGHQYRTGASIENDDGRGDGFVVATTCPVCRFTMTLDPVENANQQSFQGDRILVSKFAYDLFKPSRWDVIVFKYPGNAKLNYIKRLVGLPGELIRIVHGDIYVQRPGESQTEIARKPPAKLKAMLQLVDDTQHIADELVQAGWPSRWQAMDSAASSWEQTSKGVYQNDGSSSQPAMLRYQHIVPSHDDWNEILQGRPGDPQPQLITDFYAYNAATQDDYPAMEPQENRELGRDYPIDWTGLHWVGDLAVEAKVEVLGSSGELILDLVEAGVHYQCRIDVATGQATLEMDGGQRSFDGTQSADGSPNPQASTSIRGPGHYRLRFSNVDDELRLWVNESSARFSSPTTYVPDPNRNEPQWSESDPGDLAPIGIGSQQLALRVDRLRVSRNVYYIAVEKGIYHMTTDYRSDLTYSEILQLFRTPSEWKNTDLFASRRTDVEFLMDDDEFFPLGDNSPQSKDARLWDGGRPSVRRRLLTGKAVLIYWPHPWNSPVPMLPNFGRMGFIR